MDLIEQKKKEFWFFWQSGNFYALHVIKPVILLTKQITQLKT
jgi:hypothetical protein